MAERALTTYITVFCAYYLGRGVGGAGGIQNHQM